MGNYVGKNDNVGDLVMRLGSISKGFGGRGQHMGETSAFNITFRDNADQKAVDYFYQTYGNTPQKINFYLPSDDIDQCIIAPYTTFNAARNLLAVSDGSYFTYIANLQNPLDTKNPYLRNWVCCADGQRIRHQPTLEFVGKPKAKMSMSGQMFVFVKELLEQGVFQTMTVKFHTLRDRDMLRKRLEFAKQFASNIGVPLTAVPFFITKYKSRTSYINTDGAPAQSEHYYLELGITHSIGSETKHPLGAALSSCWNSIGQSPSRSGTNNRAGFSGTDTASGENSCSADGFSEEQPLFLPEDALDDESEEAETSEPEIRTVGDASQQNRSEWAKKLFPLSQEQKDFVKEHLSITGVNLAIRPEYLGEYKDKSGVPFAELGYEQVIERLKVADRYISDIAGGTVSVNKETETKSKMRRGALITAALILKNKYVFY